MKHITLLSSLAVVTLGISACTQPKEPLINSFEDCVAAGNPVMESYPEQCRTADGRLFVNTAQQVDVRVSEPQPNDRVGDPIRVKGEARGTWYFEATFPLRVEDMEGNILAEGYAEAQGEWMTEDFVPFNTLLPLDTQYTGDARLVIEKANASGLPENAEEIHIPIRIVELAVSPQAEMGTYIRQNINELSPEDPVLGGTFFVTDIQWQNKNTAIVTYEDGHILLVAEATAEIDAEGNVTVSDFTIVEENPPPGDIR